MAMDSQSNRQRLQRWLADIASTEAEEIDCEDLEEMLETIVAVGAGGEDIRTVLPAVAVHLDHCPECGEWYEALVALSREVE